MQPECLSLNMTLQKLAFFLVYVLFLTSAEGQEKRVVQPHVSPAIKFTENKGQWDQRVLFRAFVPGGAMFVERNSVTFNFYDHNKLRRLLNGES